MWKNFYTYLILGFATAWTIPSPWFGKFMAHVHSLKADQWFILILKHFCCHINALLPHNTLDISCNSIISRIFCLWLIFAQWRYIDHSYYSYLLLKNLLRKSKGSVDKNISALISFYRYSRSIKFMDMLCCELKMEETGCT